MQLVTIPTTDQERSPTRIRIGAVEITEPVPAMFWFRDPDGNELLMVQSG